MRLSTLLALSGVGFGYVALTACSGGGDAEESDTDTDTDTDADTDSDTDADTQDTAVPAGPLGMLAFPGDGTYNAGAYTGVEHAGAYQFNDQAAPTFTDYTVICQYTWDAIDAASDPNPVATAPDISATPCPGCDFGAVFNLHGGVETGPAGACADYGFDATFSDNTSYGYGYLADYIDPDGVAQGPALMVYSAGDPAATPPTGPAWYWNGPATYDAATGAFSYVWVYQVGYL